MWLRAGGRGLCRAGRARVVAIWLLNLMLASVPAVAQVELPDLDPTEPITISAEAGNRWVQGAYEVWALRGDCRIKQGTALAQSHEAALWIHRAAPTSRRPSKVIAFLEGDVRIETAERTDAARMTDRTWFGRFYTAASVQVQSGQVAGRPDVMPAVYQRGMERRQPPPPEVIRRTQFTEPGDEPAADATMPIGTRRVHVFPRSSTPVQAQWFPDPNSDEWIGIIDGGVMVNVYGSTRLEAIDVSTDRLVIWTRGLEEPDLTGQTLQDENVPLEIYMEGNIVFRQGERVIYAQRMYYDVSNRRGSVVDAEILTPIENYEGLLRLRAEVVQQTGPDRFFAHNSFITSSRMGRPGYRIEAGDIYFEDVQHPQFDPVSGQPLRDPETDEQLIHHERLATSQNNFLFLGELPVFYWPRLATNLEDPTFYIRQARIKNDSVYGTQVLTNWSLYELLNIRRPPEGTDWDLSLDYLSQRGFGHGTTFVYDRNEVFGVPGPVSGLVDFWGIEDSGLDNLGRGRTDLLPEKNYRHRFFWQHRHMLPGNLQLSAEAGWISERNFLEEYFEQEWDVLKDQTTGLELKRLRDNTAWSVTADVRINDFFTQTDWLPRGDHFWLGQSLFRDVFTWYEHSHAGYARFHTADAPANPADAPWDPLPWELTTGGTPVDAQGERFVTRQEIDWPLQLGLVKVVPYALGELAHWGADRDGDDVQRFYYQAGMRASMPMWRANPAVEFPLLNVHGLAHKVVFDAELSFAESNRDMDRLALYDPLDDDSIEAFRRRYRSVLFNSPPNPFPVRFDPRSYALRSGIAGWVTAPVPEVADDLAALRMGMRHRWQTKRGMPGNRRIIDWITLDANATWFPDEDRDNFGTAVGLVDYDFRWHVGDRLTLLSDGVFDFFDSGQQVVTVGGFLNRPPRGSLYLGLRLLEGPISNQVLTMSYSYWMSPKWVSSFGMSFDLGDDGNIGQRFEVTRIGESLLISAGFTVDAARDNVGVSLAVEPRFLPKRRLGRAGGAQIPVAGVYGLE